MKRTNVVLDDKLLARALRLTRARSTREVIDRALRELVLREEQRKLAEQLRGSGWLGELDEMRRR
jgi:Arc/MetJ family transcription regulator